MFRADNAMPDWRPEENEDYFPWDCDGQYEDLGNYDEDD